jgi:hypothetical protein
MTNPADVIERLNESSRELASIAPLSAEVMTEAADLLRSQSERIERLEKGWQDITTAPRDGTEVILFGLYPENDQGLPTERVTAGFWVVPEPPIIGDCGGECRCPEYGEPEPPGWATMHGGSDSGWMSTDGGFTTEWPPTHWRPLPEPPARSTLETCSHAD